MELSIIISITNLAIAIAVFYFARKRDTAETAGQYTEVIVELRTLRRDIGDMKGDIQAMRKEWKVDHDALIGITKEQSLIWETVDLIKKMEGQKNAQN